MWNGYMTNTGKAMMNQITAGGHTLTITGAMVGNVRTPIADIRNSVTLANPVASAALDSVASVTGGTSVGVRIGPSESDSYVAYEIGLYAKVDDGAAQLFAIFQEDTIGVSVPKDSVNPNFDMIIYAVIAVENDGSLIVLTDSSLYVSKAEMAAAVSEIYGLTVAEMKAKTVVTA